MHIIKRLGDEEVSLTGNQTVKMAKEMVRIISREYTLEEGKCDYESEWQFEKEIIESYGLPGHYRLMNWKKAQDLLYKGLILSSDCDLIKDKLIKAGAKSVSIDRKSTTPIAYVSVSPSKEQEYKQMLNLCGWYETNIIGEMKIITPKFGADANERVYSEHNGILYHTTPVVRKKRNNRQGLAPKSESSDNSQELVHFFSEEECVNLAPLLSVTNLKYPMEYTLYKTDLSKLPLVYVKPRFFFDPKTANAVITLDKIPPFCLFKVCDFKVSL